MKMKTILAALVLLASSAARAAGDADIGERLYQTRCIGCHSLDSSRVGPPHRGVFGRAAGAVPDYAYSDAVARSGVVWTAETLDKWLTDPETLIPGQRMSYSVPNARDRADLIAYLMSLTAGDAAPVQVP